MKKWYRSKLLWLGVAEILGGIAQLIADLPAGASVSTIESGMSCNVGSAVIATSVGSTVID